MFGRNTVLQHDKPGRTFQIAPFFGVKAPTGDDERDRFGRLPPSVQPGTGAWDFLVALWAPIKLLTFRRMPK